MKYSVVIDFCGNMVRLDNIESASQEDASKTGLGIAKCSLVVEEVELQAIVDERKSSAGRRQNATQMQKLGPDALKRLFGPQ